nr:MAG TPA: hypothetical protein [Caudoviricetes sp.]
MSLDCLYDGLGTSAYRWIFMDCFFFARFSLCIIGNHYIKGGNQNG